MDKKNANIFKKPITESDLQAVLDCDTLEAAEVAFERVLTFKRKEKYVLQHHENKITKREDDRHSGDFYYTRIKTPAGSKKVSGNYYDVIIALYDFYCTEKTGSPTLADIRPDYEQWFRQGRKPATVKISNLSYKHIRGTALDRTPICGITYQTVKKFFQDFSAKNAGRYTRSLYAKLRTDIYTMLEYALDNGIISQRVAMYNFTRDISVRFKQSEPRETWTMEEHRKLIGYLESLDGDIFALLFEYQLLTGDRFETASAMLPGDVDEAKMRVYIHLHQITADEEAGSKYMVVEGTKGNGSSGIRYVPVLPETLSVIKRAISIDPESVYVFEYNGKPLNPTTYRNHVHRLCKAAGVPYHNPHSARSFVASVLNTGGNIGEMCHYFGWSSQSMPSHYGRDISDNDSQLRSNLAKIAPRTTRTI